MMKHITTLIAGVLSCMAATAQTPPEYYNRAPYRNEFISYSTRDAAQKGDRDAERFYIPLNELFPTTKGDNKYYVTAATLEVMWHEREAFLHVEGGRNAHRVYVNDRLAGSADDSRTPSEFNFSDFVRDDLNTFSVEVMEGSEPESATFDRSREPIENMYLYSQPKLRIDDFTIAALPDSSGLHTLLSVEIVAANSYNYPEPIRLCYDIYSPEGKLLYYDMRDRTLDGHARDTTIFETTLWKTSALQWSAAKPTLYNVMLFVQRGGKPTEYIPVKIGLGQTTWDADGIMRNNKRIEIKAEHYNASSHQQSTKDIKALKKRGINTLLPDYPQPYWFYDLCDQLGMYVVDCANINSSFRTHDTTVGGALSNNPAWSDAFLERVECMYFRSRQHPCVIAFSLGGDSGNGYCMYRAYQWLKSTGDTRPVVYRGAAGQWNSDLDFSIVAK